MCTDPLTAFGNLRHFSSSHLMLREIPLEAFFQDAKVWVGQSKPQCCSQIQFVQPEFQPRDLVAGVQRPWAQQDFHHLIPPNADSRCLADIKPFTISSQLRNEHQCIFNSEVKLAFRELEHEITQKPLEPFHILVTWAVKKCCLFKWKRLSYISKKCSLFP